MYQQEAIKMALKINDECEKAMKCDDCPFCINGLGEICNLSNIQDIGVKALTDRLRQLESSYVSSDKVSENVNSPSHYCKGGMECIEAIRATCEGLDGVEAYYVGNVLKYIWRFKGKNGVEDLRKARHYLDWLIEQEEKNAGTL